MRFDSTTKIALPAVILLIGAALFFFLGCETANAQTAGEFTMTFSYGANVDEQMTETHGEKWIKDFIKPQMREKWKNHKSEAREAYTRRRAEMFDFEDGSGLTKADKDVLRDLYKKRRAWKARQDSIAEAEALKDVGALQPEYSITGPDGHRGVVHNPELIGANIGKGYVPPFDFFHGYEEGGGGGNDPGQSAGHAPGMGADLLKAMAVTVGIAAVVIAILVYAGYGVYHCYFDKR